jgi:hypothetical protein
MNLQDIKIGHIYKNDKGTIRKVISIRDITKDKTIGCSKERVYFATSKDIGTNREDKVYSKKVTLEKFAEWAKEDMSHQ